MHLRPILLALIVIAPTQTAAQLTPQQITRVDSVFARYNRNDVPGCMLGIGANGKVLYERGYGMADLEHDAPLTAASISEIGSVSKQFTTAAVVLLAQDGKLSLEDDIRKWLPELPDFGKKITVRMLANHTSGIRDQWALLGLTGNPPGVQVHSNPMILEMLSRQQDLNFPPNDQYLYSNSGYVLLAHIVARASGKPFAQFTKERIFEPLGMKNTQWRDDFTRVVKGRAIAYQPAAQGFRTEMPFTNAHGNGGLLTTVGDLLIWWDALLNNRLGKPGLTNELVTRAVLNNGKQITYALGVSVDNYRGLLEYSHGGSTAGYRAHLAAYPEAKTAVAVVCNRADANAATLLYGVVNTILADQLQRPAVAAAANAVPVSEADLKARAGMYRDRNTEELMVLEVENGKLVSRRGAAYELIPLGNDVYRRSGTNQELRFISTNNSFRINRGESDGTTIVLEKVQPLTLTPAQLAEYAGKYFSPELDVVADITVENDYLTMRRKFQPSMRLSPSFKDGFTGAGYFVFTRDAAGKVNGFKFTQGRVRHFRFVRQ